MPLALSAPWLLNGPTWSQTVVHTRTQQSPLRMASAITLALSLPWFPMLETLRVGPRLAGKYHGVGLAFASMGSGLAQVTWFTLAKHILVCPVALKCPGPSIG